MSEQIFGKYARQYWEKGYSVIPVNGKKPAIKGWDQYSTRLPEKEVFEAWEKQFPTHNIGLVVGPQSKCAALDIDIRDDEPELLEFIEQFVPESPVRKRGKKAYTALFQESDLQSRSFGANGEKKIEFFSSNRQIVIPPSIHPDTQEPYKWMGPSLLEVGALNLPPITAATLQKLEKAISDKFPSTQTQATEKSETGNRNNRLKDICTRHIHQRWSDEDIAEVLLETDWSENEDNSLFVERRSSTNSTDPATNALDFVKSIRRSINNGRTAQGQDPINSGPLRSTPIKMESQINLVPLKDLSKKKFADQSWILEGILPAGGTSILVGPPKIGKTTFIRQLALAVSGGREIINRKTTAGRVLLFALEEKESEVQKHFLQLGGADEDIHIHCGRIDNMAPKFVESIIRSHNPKLVIIDTLFHFLNPDDTNSYTDMTRRMSPLIDVARKSGCHILFTHHTNKNSEVSGTNSIMGSNAIFGAVDSAIMFVKRGSTLALDITQRYGPKDSIAMRFDQTNRKFEVDEKSSSNLLNEIFEYLRENGASSKNAIVKGVRGNREAILETINEAVENNELIEISSSRSHPLISLPVQSGEPGNGIAPR